MGVFVGGAVVVVMVVKLTFYGGVDEIGGNKILVETGDGCVLLDFGRSMGLYSEFFAEFLQVRSKNALRDLLRLGLLPRVNGIYAPHLVDTTLLFEGEHVFEKVPFEAAKDYWRSFDVEPYSSEKPFVDGVFVSHAHFDHIQDLSFLDKQIPVYCTPETHILAKAVSDVSVLGVDDQYYQLKKEGKITLKSKNFKTLCPGECDFTEDKPEEPPTLLDSKTGFYFTHEIKPKLRVFNTSLEGKIKGIHYKLIPVGHSVPGACSILLTLPDGQRLLYTGDLRFHGANEITIDEYVAAIGVGGVDIMITEGTRIQSENIITETQVGQTITQDIAKTNGLALISFGWKDLTRFNTIYQATKINNRTLIITPKLAYLLYEMHHNFPNQYSDPRKMENLKVYLKRENNLLYSATDYPDKWKLGYLHHHGRNISKDDQNIIRIAEHLNIGGEINNPKNPLPKNNPDCNYQETYNLAIHHLKHGIRAYQIRQNPKQYVLMFNFWDANELFDILPQNNQQHNTHYIAASTEPFNEEMEIDENKMLQWINHFNITCDTEQTNKSQVKENQNIFKRRHVSGHVSGHASKPELQELINKIKPKTLIPIHTQNPQTFQEIYHGNIIHPKHAQTIQL